MAERRTVRVHARVSPAEIADRRAKAAAVGVSLSGLLRQAMARTRTVDRGGGRRRAQAHPADRPHRQQPEAARSLGERQRLGGREADRKSTRPSKPPQCPGALSLHDCGVGADDC